MSYTQSHVFHVRYRDSLGWGVRSVLMVAFGVLVLAACGASESDSASAVAVSVDSGEAETMDDGTEAMDTGAMAPMTSIGSLEWEGMEVEVAVTAPTTFTLFQGDATQEVTPEPDDAFHVMAVLSDAEGGERIPYADLWVTFTSSSGDVVFDERLWPMLSRAMGTHYGINVGLPEPGTYSIAVQVGAPQGARHPEYADRWLEATSLDFEFTWSG